MLSKQPPDHLRLTWPTKSGMGVSLQQKLSPLVGGDVTDSDRRVRLLLFVAWLALAAWFCTTHVVWRDEVRAFSLALSGSNVFEMLGNVHGEGHPALWYLILRGGHWLFPYREALPVAAALIGVATMAILAFCSPFRTIVIAVILFSFYGAFEYVAVARNYCISALVMFVIAALYPRIRNSLCVRRPYRRPVQHQRAELLACRGVPAVSLCRAAHRRVEPARREWLIFAGNCAIAALGAYLAFRTVYRRSTTRQSRPIFNI